MYFNGSKIWGGETMSHIGFRGFQLRSLYMYFNGSGIWGGETMSIHLVLGVFSALLSYST